MNEYGIPEIERMIVIGPSEIEKAFRNESHRFYQNPLSLSPGWCPRPDIPYATEQLKEISKLCSTPEWDTKFVLWLALPEVAGMPTSLINQHRWWGVRYGGFRSGIIREDLVWPSLCWYHQKSPYLWAMEAAVCEPKWLIGYDLPRWTIKKNWIDQQESANQHGLMIQKAVTDALMVNLVAICWRWWGFRDKGAARTSTIYDKNKSPLLVARNNQPRHCSIDDGYHAGLAFDSIGLAVEGFPHPK